MTQPCQCRACDNCPCPTDLPVVLMEWEGDFDFTNYRDITQMPGWSRALEHNRNADAAGYLWRIIGFNWNESAGYFTFDQLLESPPVSFEATAANGDTLAIGPIRGFRMENQGGGSGQYMTKGFIDGNYVDRISTGYRQNGDYVGGYNSPIWSKVGYFGSKTGSPPVPQWEWVGSEALDVTWARYQLQLGVIRCDCGNGRYVNWPQISVTRPTSMILLSEGDDVTTERLEIPPSTYGGTIGFGTDGSSQPIAVTWNASAQDVADAIERIPGVTFATASGGPLPFHAIVVNYHRTLFGTRITPDFSRLILPANGVACRRMIEIEEDARAWGGNEESPRMPRPCAVDVLTDGIRSLTLFDRIGYVESDGTGSIIVSGPPPNRDPVKFAIHSAFRSYSLDEAKVIFLENEFMWWDPGEYTYRDATSFLQPFRDWLALGGKVLVLNGVAAAADTAATYANAIDSGDPWNSVLSFLGCYTTLTGICNSVGWDVSVIQDREVGAPFSLSYTLEPAVGSHPLLEHAESANWETNFGWPSVGGGSPWSYQINQLEQIGLLTPGGNATVLYNLTEAITKVFDATLLNRTRIDQTIPAIVVEQVGESWVIVTNFLRTFSSTESMSIGSGPIHYWENPLRHVPTNFLRDILEKLPYS